MATLLDNVRKAIKHGDKYEAKEAFEKYIDNLPSCDSIAAERDALKRENADLQLTIENLPTIGMRQLQEIQQLSGQVERQPGVEAWKQKAQIAEGERAFFEAEYMQVLSDSAKTEHRLKLENAELVEVLRNLTEIATPVFNQYDEDYEEHEMNPGAPTPDGLFIALNAARATIARHNPPPQTETSQAGVPRGIIKFVDEPDGPDPDDYIQQLLDQAEADAPKPHDL